MLSTLLLGAASSVIAEIITKLNQKLNGTVLTGDAAWLLAAIVAIVIATSKVLMSGIPTDWASFVTECGMIWAASQVIFMGIVQQFGLDVASPAVAGKIVTS